MLPILFKIQFGTPTMQIVGLLLCVAMVAYGAWSGWRGAPTQESAPYRALPFGVLGGLVALVGVVYMAPPLGPTAAGIVKALIWITSGALVGTAMLYARKLGEDLALYGGLATAAGAAAIKFGIYDGAIGRGLGAPLHTYGLMLASAFAAAIWISQREAPRAYPETIKIKGKVEPLGPIMRDHVLDLAMWVVAGGLIGSRVLFVITKWKDYQRDWTQIFSLSGGLVFYGGFIGAALVVVWYCKVHKIDFLRLADVLVPSVALAHAIGRMGCLAAGCCWGGIAKAGSAIAIRFPSAAKLGWFNFGTDSMAYADQAKDSRYFDSFGHLHEHFVNGAQQISHVARAEGFSVPVYPTQLMESAGELTLFLLLILLRKHKRFHGQVFGAWLAGYAVLRFVIELFRGDEIRNFLFRYPSENPVILSTSQTISLAMFVTGAAIWVVYGRKKKTHDDQAKPAAAAAA